MRRWVRGRAFPLTRSVFDEPPSCPLPRRGEGAITAAALHATAARCTARASDAVMLERCELRFARPLNQSPLVPAKAGTQGPSTHSFQRLGPRFCGDERNSEAIQTQLALAHRLA